MAKLYMNMVQNISEYANEIIEGQNEFLDYSSKLTMQLNKQPDYNFSK